MAGDSGVMIRYDGVSKHYGDTVAVDDIDLSVERGEFMALIGPSGSGKTTTLRMLAGFETPTEGAVHLAGTNVVGVPPHKRDTATVFQNYALFPHMTVGENVAFGLKRRNYDRERIDSRVDEVLEMVDMPELRDRKTTNLSGGQQQRVATARALAPEPSVLLMDEPLGALDKKLRDQIRVDFSRLQNELDITTLYVTHNQEEALTMADRIAVMNRGRIEQIGTPTEVYWNPETRFVSDFIGNTNILEGNVTESGGQQVLMMNGTAIRLNSLDGVTDETTVFVRPENMELHEPGSDTGQDNVLPGRLRQVLFLGDKFQYFIEAAGQEFVVDGSSKGGSFREGDEVLVTWDDEDTKVVSE